MKVWIFTPFAIEAARHFHRELLSGRMLFMDDQTLKLNPLQPVNGQSLTDLVGTRADAARSDFFWRDGTCNLFANVTEGVYSKQQTTANEGPYPSLHDLLKEVRRLHFSLKRRAEYAESLERGLASVLRHAGDILDCSEGMNMYQLACTNTIFNFGSLDTTTKVYLLHCLVDNLVAYRQINPGPHHKLMLLIDEAPEYLVRSEERDDIHEDFLEALSRRARHYGIVLCFISQTAFDIPAPLMANIQNKVLFRIEDGPSKRVLAATLGLTPQQTLELGLLEERLAVVKLHTFPEPFLIVVPTLETETVDDRELTAAIEAGKAAARRLSWRPRATLEAASARTSDANDDAKHEDIEEYTKPELDYLEYLGTNEPHPATVGDGRRRIPASTGSAIRSSLAKKEAITLHRYSIGRGGQVTVPWPTEKTFDMLARMKVKGLVTLHGRGDFDHRLAQWAIRKACIKEFAGCTAEIEKSIEDGYVDVSLRLAPKDSGRLTAYEVSISGEPARELANITKCLASGYDHVVMVCANEGRLTRIKEMVETQLGAEWRDKVSFSLLRECLLSAWGLNEAEQSNS